MSNVIEDHVPDISAAFQKSAQSSRIHRNSMRDVRFESTVVEDVPLKGTATFSIVKGNFNSLPPKVKRFIAEHVLLCQPKGVYICDGTEAEAEEVTEKMVERGMLTKLTASRYDNCRRNTDEDSSQMKTAEENEGDASISYVCSTDPADVARVESRTFICTPEKYETVPRTVEGVKCTLGNWMDPDKMESELADRFPGCMQGRVMYVIPFSMGPVGGNLSKIGVQLTDFNYVLLSMRIMTRVTSRVWHIIGDGDFVKCVHSIGSPRPLPASPVNHWPCNPSRIVVAHFPSERRVMSYGSGYGGNSLLGKKCFALRIASCIGRDEGWLAEHMLLMKVKPPGGRERFIAAAFPSACGKTNMAMLMPTLPGWEVSCLGDDIVWMRFDKNGRLRAVNPEAGFFGVAPGTNTKTNPVAMATISSDTIFTNVARTSDGGVFWEGMEKEVDQDCEITAWLGEKWRIGDSHRAAHPNSRFCTPASNCPIIDARFDDPEGVPVDAIIWGGRQPEGVPLVMEALSWPHGVMLGAAIKSLPTASAEHTGRKVMHDPMAMRPFLGYNFGEYLQHWLDQDKPGRHMPRIFHVNWFRLDSQGKFAWPGFGENIRVIDWMCRRLDGEDIAVESPIGLLPKKGTINMDGLKNVNWDEIFSLPKQFWQEDIRETKRFLEEQVTTDLPEVIRQEVEDQLRRIDSM